MAIRLKSGDVLRLLLGSGWGFAYAKYLNILGLESNDSYSDLLPVFAYRSAAAEVPDPARLQAYLLPPTLWAGRACPSCMRADLGALGGRGPRRRAGRAGRGGN